MSLRECDPHPPLSRAASSFRLLKNAVHAVGRINPSLSKPKLEMSPLVGALRETKQRLTDGYSLAGPVCGSRRSTLRSTAVEPRPPTGPRSERFRVASCISDLEDSQLSGSTRRSLFCEQRKSMTERVRTPSEDRMESVDTPTVRQRRASNRRPSVLSPTGRRETRKFSVIYGDVSCTKEGILKSHAAFIADIRKHDVVGTSLLKIFKAALHVFRCDELSAASFSVFLQDTKLEPSASTSRLIDVLCVPSLCFKGFVLLMLSFSDDSNRSAFARTPVAVLSKLISDKLLRYYR
eukprot:TRINITY_DN9138_c0_g1_i1.p1 TRINITY_DN9138_c0_g1~~TRINITY_DN9138_c0_g1_i1.p1  ORF type:complete len:311 (+),score=53.19 TRINITY_DN9138_c0_g1_i1:55-933(+)